MKMHNTSKEINRRLKGRKIVKVKLNPFSDGNGRVAHNPCIYLDDGTRILFSTEETDCGEYGTAILLSDPEEGT